MSDDNNAVASDVKMLMGAYDDADKLCEKLKSDYDMAVIERSKLVHSIAAKIAPVKRLVRNGKELTIVVRGDTAFFRSAKNGTTFEID